MKRIEVEVVRTITTGVRLVDPCFVESKSVAIAITRTATVQSIYDTFHSGLTKMLVAPADVSNLLLGDIQIHETMRESFTAIHGTATVYRKV